MATEVRMDDGVSAGQYALMMNLRLILSVLALATVGLSAAEFYVAPDGRDANPGTQAKPFATFHRAQEAARAERAQRPGQGVTVIKPPPDSRDWRQLTGFRRWLAMANLQCGTHPS